MYKSPLDIVYRPDRALPAEGGAPDPQFRWEGDTLGAVLCAAVVQAEQAPCAEGLKHGSSERVPAESVNTLACI